MSAPNQQLLSPLWMPSEIPISVCLAFAQPSKTSDQSVKQARQASKQAASNQARAIKQAIKQANPRSKAKGAPVRLPDSAILRTTIHWLLPLRQIRNPHHACLLASVRLVSMYLYQIRNVRWQGHVRMESGHSSRESSDSSRRV